MAAMTSATDPPAETCLHLGFDGGALEAAGSRATMLWRIGRWLRTQGARRPARVQVVDHRTVIVDGRILLTDEFGGVRDLSTTRRVSGTRLASLASWGRRR
jgi:hypothetical protein